MPNEELILLKDRATAMGIAYSPNIGLDALKAKIDAKLNTEVTPATVTPGDDGDDDVPAFVDEPLAKRLTKTEALQAERMKQHAEQLKLVRIRVTNLNPVKKDLRGEIFTVANGIIGTIRKFVPYGEDTDNGFHVPFIIYNELKDRKFVSIKTRRSSTGKDVVEQRMVSEFALEVLDQLTPKELDQLKHQQAAAAGMD